MKTLITLLAIFWCMALLSVSHALPQDMHPGNLPAAWNTMKKQQRLTASNREIRVDDRLDALALLQKLGVTTDPQVRVELSKDGYVIVLIPGKLLPAKAGGVLVFYELHVTEPGKSAYIVRIVGRG